MKILVLDDSLERHKIFARNLIGNEIFQAFNYEQAITVLNQQQFDLIFLDHDLSYDQEIGNAADEKTGADVALYLADLDLEHKPEIIVHSLNPAGANNIFQILIQAGFYARKIPFLGLFST